MDSILKRMDAVYERVSLLLSAWRIGRKGEGASRRNQECGGDRFSFLDCSSVVPPGKPIPPASKQIQNSMNSYMSRAKSSIESTMSSAKSGDIKEKLTDSMSSFGDKMSQVMDKAKSTVQNLRTWCCLLSISIGSVVALFQLPFHCSIQFHAKPIRKPMKSHSFSQQPQYPYNCLATRITSSFPVMYVVLRLTIDRIAAYMKFPRISPHPWCHQSDGYDDAHGRWA